MDWGVQLLEIGLRFLLGTVVLWLCSMTTDSPNANFKTALIYNGIAAGVGVGLRLFALAIISAHLSGGFIIAIVLIALIFLFILLMTLYEISFFAALWLLFAMIAVTALVNRVAGGLL